MDFEIITQTSSSGKTDFSFSFLLPSFMAFGPIQLIKLAAQMDISLPSVFFILPFDIASHTSFTPFRVDPFFYC